MKNIQVLITLLFCFHQWRDSFAANSDAERLYDDLMNRYNSVIRPVGNNSDRLTVTIGLRLSQLIDVVSVVISHILVRVFSIFLIMFL